MPADRRIPVTEEPASTRRRWGGPVEPGDEARMVLEGYLDSRVRFA